MSKIAALISGGLDSCILVNQLLDAGHQVYPIYIRQGLCWEVTEELFLGKFLTEIRSPELQAIQFFDLPVTDIYGEHWSVSGAGVPNEFSEDSAVYLPGRNLLLLIKVGIWCSMNDVGTIALASLSGNPFSDNTDNFYNSVSKTLEIALQRSIKIIRPFCNMSKTEIILKAQYLPLHLTFSCIGPVNNQHCGVCNKCAERKLAFKTAEISDQTPYIES